jgi:serine/threonine protein phosphatase PrpC
MWAFEIDGATHPGLGKTRNEDWCCVRAWPEREEALMVVADGVGSERLADRAARIMVDTIAGAYDAHRRRHRFDWSVDCALKEALFEADRSFPVHRTAMQEGAGDSLYSTASAVAYSDGMLAIAYLGDSPVIVFDGEGAVVWRSCPHADPRSGALLRYAGSGRQEMEPTLEMRPCPKNGLVVVGSDGLVKLDPGRPVGSLSEQEIWQICTKAPTLEGRRRNADDVTVLLGRSLSQQGAAGAIEDPEDPGDATGRRSYSPAHDAVRGPGIAGRPGRTGRASP